MAKLTFKSYFRRVLRFAIVAGVLTLALNVYKALLPTYPQLSIILGVVTFLLGISLAVYLYYTDL